MHELKLTILPASMATRLLMTDGPDEVLKARLGPAALTHRLAASMLLEGLALWYQRPLRVVVSADAQETSSALSLSDGLGLGVRTLHYDVEVVERGHRRRRGARLDGVGDFRELRQLCLEGTR